MVRRVNNGHRNQNYNPNPVPARQVPAPAQNLAQAQANGVANAAFAQQANGAIPAPMPPAAVIPPPPYPGNGQPAVNPPPAAVPPVATPPVNPTPNSSGIWSAVTAIDNTAYAVISPLVSGVEIGANVLYNTPAFVSATVSTLLTGKTWNPLTNNYSSAKKSLKDQTKPVDKMELPMGGGKVLKADAFNAEISDERSVGRKAGEAVAHGVAGLTKLALIGETAFAVGVGLNGDALVGKFATFEKFSPTYNMVCTTGQAIMNSADTISAISAKYQGFKDGAVALNEKIIKIGENACWDNLKTPFAPDCNTWGTYANGIVQVVKEEATPAVLTAANVASTAGSVYLFAKSYTKFHETCASPATTIIEKAVRTGKMAGYGASTVVSGALSYAGVTDGIAGQVNMGKAMVSGAGSAISGVTSVVKCLNENVDLTDLREELSSIAETVGNIGKAVVTTIAEHPVAATNIAMLGSTAALALKARHTYQPGTKLKAIGWGLAAVATSLATVGFNYYNFMNGPASGANPVNGTTGDANFS